MTASDGSRAWRQLASKVLVATGAVVLTGGLLFAYTSRALFDPDAFAERAARSLENPAVAALVADALTDQIVQSREDLIAVRPLIVALTRTVVVSDAFGAVFRRAARQAHRVAFSAKTEKLLLSIPDVGVLVRSALAQSQPALADKIPQGVRGRVTADVGRAVPRVILSLLRIAASLRWLADAGLALGVVLLAGGGALAPLRRDGLLRVGVAVGVAGGVLAIVPALGTLFWTLRSNSAAGAAVGGVWGGFTDDLRVWGMVVGAIGLACAAAATSWADRVDVEATIRRGWDLLRRPARTPAQEVARALTLTALGVATVLHPVAALRVLAAFVGALLAFEGLRECFHALVLRGEVLTGSAGGRRGSRVPTALRLGLVSIGAVALVAAGIVYLHWPAGLRAPGTVTVCNGAAALCDRPLDAVVFPGAHNAMSAADQAGWMFPNQERGIPAQLRDGIRALLFDVHYGIPVGGGIKTDLANEEQSRAKYAAVLGEEGVAAAMRIRDRLVGAPEGPRQPYLCHGFCELGAQPLVPMLTEIRRFMVENPGEVLVFVIEDADVAPADVAAAFAESGLIDFVYRGQPSPPWPTLREMIRTDERIVVLAENNAGSVPWYHQAFEVMQETPYSFKAPDQFSCAPNRGGTAGSLFLVNHWIDSAPAPRPSNAAVVNASDVLLARAERCERERGRRPNVLAVDFYCTGDVVAVARELNGVH
jgi:hypothetical protein